MQVYMVYMYFCSKSDLIQKLSQSYEVHYNVHTGTSKEVLTGCWKVMKILNGAVISQSDIFYAPHQR